jgi:hypothetical protein
MNGSRTLPQRNEKRSCAGLRVDTALEADRSACAARAKVGRSRSHVIEAHGETSETNPCKRL